MSRVAEAKRRAVAEGVLRSIGPAAADGLEMPDAEDLAETAFPDEPPAPRAAVPLPKQIPVSPLAPQPAAVATPMRRVAAMPAPRTRSIFDSLDDALQDDPIPPHGRTRSR
jgi:hypothetical protein